MRTAIISSIVTVIVLITLLIMLNYVTAPPGKKSPVKRRGDFMDLTIRLPVPWLFSGKKPKPNKVIYMNREGATLIGGGDDATANRATLAGPTRGDTIHVPPFRGNYLRWNQIVKCARAAFKPFDVEIVEERPMDSDYMMVMLGGQPKLLNNAKGKAHLRATGMAPHNGLPIHNAVVLVFSRLMRESARRTCETTVHEIAHAYGLDHTFQCRDFMTYLPYCGKKRFVNKDVPCGEGKKRKCYGGGAKQNSYKTLVKVLGLHEKD